ncbi:MAG: 30S ribosome-binding factor RbfA [Christensenellaceae bacterium]|jgi:ribosome-binding factor A|nr:30S ribosome-binding factor RbfA [Christensenellaceae bacterium]
MNLERVNSEIKKELSSLLRNELKDPRLESYMLTVTRVTVTQDLKHGKVWVSVLGDNTNEVISILNKSAGFLKSELFKRLKIRAVPDLKFLIDDGVSYYTKIEKILGEIKGTTPDEQ